MLKQESQRDKEQLLTILIETTLSEQQEDICILNKEHDY